MGIYNCNNLRVLSIHSTHHDSLLIFVPQDQAGAIEAILTSNLMAQFQEQNGKEPSDEEVEDMLASMKESGLYEQAAGRIAALLSGLGGDAEEEEDEESEEEEEEAPPPKKKSRRNK